MIRYECKQCKVICTTEKCPFCGKRSEIKSEIFWCNHCKVPLYQDTCDICKGRASKLTTDIRPVFPEERLLLGVLYGNVDKFMEAPIWNGSGNNYYVDGKKISIFKVRELKYKDKDEIRRQLQRHRNLLNECSFDEDVRKFVKANRRRYEEIVEDAFRCVQEYGKKYTLRDMLISFSGGKDSTVVANIVTRALGTNGVVHLFGDTTLEFPETLRYIKRFRMNNPNAILVSAKNREKNFFELCDEIGPPSRVMRWCCTIFKTGAISRKITSMYGERNHIVTFYGIRRSESSSRSKYEKEASSPKITKQTVVSPIIDWMDMDVWLYLLTTGIDFNDAYRLGYTRVGCWCCPNNSEWSEFLSSIYMPEQVETFHKQLVAFAKNIGKLDAEAYVMDGKWKARQGGNGIEKAKKAIVRFEPCVLEENTVNYELSRPITPQLYELFRPFGWLDEKMGNARLGEIYVKGKDGEVLLRLQGRIGTHTLKVTMYKMSLLGARGQKAVEEKIRAQLTKYQTCIGCLACESVCKFNALSVRMKEGEVDYTISDEKCRRCGECVSHFNRGCYMSKVLAIKEQHGGKDEEEKDSFKRT